MKDHKLNEAKLFKSSQRLKIFVLTIVLTALVLNSSSAWAAMESGSYRINFDSINIGGERSSSTNYGLEDTAGESATGESASAAYKMFAGYQQMNEVYLAISSPADTTLSPNLDGVSGGQGSGTVVWNVLTDNPAGYSLYIKAGSTPALQDGAGHSFANYTPSGSDPDYGWSVSSGTSEFGFSPEGNDIDDKYRDNGSACNTGALDTPDACWDSLTTSDKLIAGSPAANHTSGTNTSVKFRAEVGANVIQYPGNYTASVTVTALPL